MTVKLIPEIFQQLSQQVNTARDSLQRLFDDEYGQILNEHIREKEELTSKIDLITKESLELKNKLDKEFNEKKEIECELIRLQNLSSSYTLRFEKELTDPIISDQVFYGIPNLEKKIDEAIFDATNFFGKNCPYCGNSLYQGHVRSKIEIDHFIPISKGGQNFPWNIIPICKDCNRKKRNKLPSEFLEKKRFEICFNYLNDVKKRFSADIDCVGIFEIIKKIIYDNMDLLHDKNKAVPILHEIAELVHPGINSMLTEVAGVCETASVSTALAKDSCLPVILETSVKLLSGHEEKTIAELIIAMTGMKVIDESDDAQKTLKKYGIKVVQDGFIIANRHMELSKILKKTPWAKDWSSILVGLPGASKINSGRFNDVVSRAVKLPLSYIN